MNLQSEGAFQSLMAFATGGRLLDCLLHHVSGRSTRCARVNLIDLAHRDVPLTRMLCASKIG
jgi:hypothetical protein